MSTPTTGYSGTLHAEKARAGSCAERVSAVLNLKKAKQMLALTAGVFILALGPAQAKGADIAATELNGCWRDTYPIADLLAQGTEVRMLPDGSYRLVWKIDPSLEDEMLIMVPYHELCFSSDGAMISTNIGFNEGRDTNGTYQVEGDRITLRDSYYPSDAWLFLTESTTCTLNIQGAALALSACTDGKVDPVEYHLVRHADE